ncbi:hypothetical protein C9I84_102 [Candidatus Vidania fulgoroideae]|uniref:Uncharacterized protein n=1 Tax=Candidatus Vidania fulgoroideorum TaxID=881286 RepID=A0A346E0I9_9PROT|nr:hypothetical protein C9I84_102 [Candidatus Vidania fulgoroideae]
MKRSLFKRIKLLKRFIKFKKPKGNHNLEKKKKKKKKKIKKNIKKKYIKKKYLFK